MAAVWGEDGAKASANKGFTAVLDVDAVVDVSGALQQAKHYSRGYGLEAKHQTPRSGWLFSVLGYLDLGYEDSRICRSVQTTMIVGILGIHVKVAKVDSDAVQIRYL
jgi:hypothetical protein